MSYKNLKTTNLKKILTFLVSFLLFIFNGITYGQTFSHHFWKLNETVTFNDVVNYFEDKSKIITEPSVYVKGEDIKFYDDYNTTTTLTFFPNTQILKSVLIKDIESFDYVKKLRQSVFQQLGNPTWGCEKEIFNDVKDNSMSDSYTYEFQYEYKIGMHIISIHISSYTIRGIYSFSAIIHKNTDSYYKFPNYDNFYDNFDYGWLKTKTVILNKW